ncbi:MAG: B12-binding domain-containing radical SAM protein [Gemmatimonadetes bacterium]|nr:MAG: B12-binding domain-containing radical SAM protein [Gemmatimonadota bacterium]
MRPNIVFYNPVSNGSGKRILPMSLLALGALLEGNYEYTLVDGNCEGDALTTLRARITAGANLLAITVMPGPQLAWAVPHSRALKREFPHLQIVWGGYFPTQHSDVILQDPAVDFTVRGHGETVFLNLLDALGKNSDHGGIAGLAYRDASGQVVQNGLAPIPHPDRLPPFPYHRIDIQRYIRPTFLGSRTLPHHSSYGCPFFCNFCAVVNMVNGRWLPQAAARVADIAQMYVNEWRINAIEFYDNNFFTHEARTAEFAERILPLGLAWWGEARIDTLLKYSEKTWRLMRDSGLKMVFLGAESGSLETLQRMDKGGTMSPDKTLELAGKMKDYDIVPEFSFVLGNPPDAEGDVRHTIEFIRRVKVINSRSEIIMYNYTPVPLAGDLYDAAQAEGFHFPKTLDEWISDPWQRFAQRYSDVVPWLNRALRQRVRDFERVLNAYYPTSTDAHLTGMWRRVLRGVSAWRYRTRLYGLPLELQALQRLVRYQRPETSGF